LLQTLSLYAQLQKRIQELDKVVEGEAQSRPQACRLLTRPGVGPVTALATEVFLGDPGRFRTGKQVASYIGMIPGEHSSGQRQRLGKSSKEGNALLRYLWCEATMHAVGKVFRQYRSQPVTRVIELINPVLRGWVNYFAVGHSGRCFHYVKDWVAKKVRRHVMQARKREGYGWGRWSRQWPYETLGLFDDYRVRYFVPKAT